MFQNIIVVWLSWALGCSNAAESDSTDVAAFKGQSCTDPRTMRKHAAYTEWADAYSCTRHRCQPGGRNLAIYTVGCKRVEAPESAIECEEVVEDTNMQFPYCCTRLRCLVVVRGEVWTRVLGQPWETLPAAPWSHMYKMKKPPPSDSSFLPNKDEGPVYELQLPETENANGDKSLRANRKGEADHNDAVSRAAPPPDIVIALSTDGDKQFSRKNEENPRHKRVRSQNTNNFLEEGEAEPRAEDQEEPVTEAKEQKPLPEPAASEERYYGNAYAPVTPKPIKQQQQAVDLPSNQWNESLETTNSNVDVETRRDNTDYRERERLEPDMEALRLADTQTTSNPAAQTWEHQPEHDKEPRRVEERKDLNVKPTNLQALVAAIGTRMKDIESVVASMSDKVQKEMKTGDADVEQLEPVVKSNDDDLEVPKDMKRMKRPNPDNEHYKSHSKYVHSAGDSTTDQPLFIEEANLKGYFSDASNSLIRRNLPKKPAITYMAPVMNARRKTRPTPTEDFKTHSKKIVHKKKSKAHHKKHHVREDKRRKFRLNSNELDRNAVSFEEGGAAVASK